MKCRWRDACAVLMLGLGLVPGRAIAQSEFHDMDAIEAIDGFEAIDDDETVYQYDLSGPRFGATMARDGTPISQFGWHFESQASPGRRGPWFIVERVLLLGGLEYNTIVPSGTLIFGMRLPSSFEFGIGPSVTLGLGNGATAGLVAAIGHSYRFGGIRVPVNVAVAHTRGGEPRVSIVTGWAIRDRRQAAAERAARRRPPTSGVWQ